VCAKCHQPSCVQSGDGLGVVITGGSRGLGFALAREHLAAGDRVVICGRDGARLRSAAAALRRDVPGAAIHAAVCDVSNGHGAILGASQRFLSTSHHVPPRTEPRSLFFIAVSTII